MEPENEKDRCCSCGKKRIKVVDRYSLLGNYCSDCSVKVDLMSKWRILKHKKTKGEEDEERLAILAREIFKKWGIDMMENDRQFQGMRKREDWERFWKEEGRT
jgi:hypothetical protein